MINKKKLNPTNILLLLDTWYKNFQSLEEFKSRKDPTIRIQVFLIIYKINVWALIEGVNLWIDY